MVRILWSLWRSFLRDYQFLFDAGAVAFFGPGTKISDAAIKILEILIGD
jgi:methylmalonyl-CoA mutase